MRSLLCLGGAMLLCAAGLLYLAADYAGRHPDSPTACCLRTAQTLCDPLAMFTSVSEHTARAVGEMMSQTATATTEFSASACREHAACAPAQAEGPPEVIDLTLSPEPWEKPECQEETEAAALLPEPIAEPEVVTVMPGEIEESEEVPASMPPADGEEIPPPTEMPAAEAKDEQEPAQPSMEDLIREQLDATRQHVFELWFDLFQKSGEPGVTDEEPPAAPATQAEEQSAEPADEDQTAEPMDESNTAEPATEENKTTEPETAEDSQTEESEPTAPDCPVDPNYHTHYPACPYTGDAEDKQPECAPTYHHRKKVKQSPIVDPKPDVEESDVPPSDVMRPFPLEHVPVTDRPQNLGPTPDDETPRHPEVDTMEFRKGDAKEGEFDSRPF